MKLAARAFSPIGHFIRGAAYPVQAIGRIADRRVLGLTLLPFVIGLALYVALIVLLVVFGGRLTDTIVQGGSWWRTALRVLVWAAMVGLLAVVFVFTYALVAMVLAAPLYEFLSVAIERRHTGGLREAEGGWKEMLIDTWRALSDAVKFLLLAGVAWLLGLTAPPVTPVIAFMVIAVLVGLEFMDSPMGRRRLPFRQKLWYGARHAWMLMGFGSLMTLMMLIPVVGAFFLPLGVIGGTMMFCDLEAMEAGKQDADDNARTSAR